MEISRPKRAAITGWTAAFVPPTIHVPISFLGHSALYDGADGELN
jgi:hypothetical protein